MSELYNFRPKSNEAEIADYPEDDLTDSLSGSLEHFNNLIDMMPVALMIQRDEKILYTNPSYLRLFGYEKTDVLIGHSVLDTIPPEFHSEIQKREKSLVQKKTFYNPFLEMPSIKKNGEIIYTEGESVFVIYQGKPAAMIMIRDITLRKKAQMELRKSEENFQNIIREMPYGVLIVDESRVLFNNNSYARMLGYDSPLEIIGRQTMDFVHPDCRALSAERVRMIFKDGGSSLPAKFKLLGKDGKEVDVESSVIAIRYNDQKAVMAVIRDITTQNQMERQAALNDKLATVGTLAAGVAHEVNNPLTYILGNLSFLKDHQEELKIHTLQKNQMDPVYQKLYSYMSDEVNDCVQGGERIRDIVKGLKAFVRNSEDKTEKVGLNQMIESALNMTYHVFKHKARLEKDMAVDLPFLMLHTGKIQQVFINLIINAAQAIEGNSAEKNKIRIRTGREGSNLFVEISDTGAGIPENILTRIFDPFFTTKPVGVGTGLGLSVCNEILTQYQGSLEVRSKVGVGSAFTVRLPLTEVHPDEELKPPDPAGFRYGKVLVVDDEPGNLDVMRKVLNKKHEVLSALSGEEAMTILKEKGDMVDVIVSDVNMPEMSGIAFYKIVAQTFPGFEKKFVFITGGIFSEENKDFLRGIPNLCLEKPFEFEKLFEAVAQLTGRPSK